MAAMLTAQICYTSIRGRLAPLQVRSYYQVDQFDLQHCVCAVGQLALHAGCENQMPRLLDISSYAAVTCTARQGLQTC